MPLPSKASPLTRRFALGLRYLVVVALVMDGVAQLLRAPPIVNGMRESGFDISVLPVLSGIVLTCALLLAIPRTAALGAIVVTGFLGGAIAIHFREGQVGSPPQLISLGLGIAMWASFYLRNDHIYQVLPFMRRDGGV